MKDSLEVKLNSPLLLRLTERGDILTPTLLFQTHKSPVEIREVSVKLTKPVISDNKAVNYAHANTTEAAKSFLTKNTTKWLQINILHRGINNDFGKAVHEYKNKVYIYANSIKFRFGSDQDLTDTEINKSFDNIKEEYKQKLFNNIFLTPGIYHIEFKINHINETNSFIKSKPSSIIKNGSFKIDTYGEDFMIALDNFLGQIMSNVLFSPQNPMKPIEPILHLTLI